MKEDSIRKTVQWKCLQILVNIAKIAKICEILVLTCFAKILKILRSPWELGDISQNFDNFWQSLSGILRVFSPLSNQIKYSEKEYIISYILKINIW
jgi:hypothetical protein